MPLIEFSMTPEGKIRAVPTNETYVPSLLDQRAAADSAEHRKILDAQLDERRSKFYKWSLENPNELDMLLDAVHENNILWEHEYDKE